jgi:hypothetical protein
MRCGLGAGASPDASFDTRGGSDFSSDQWNDGWDATAEGSASPLRANRLDVTGMNRGWLTLYLDC